jgi:hypothetical protein
VTSGHPIWLTATDHGEGQSRLARERLLARLVASSDGVSAVPVRPKCGFTRPETAICKQGIKSSTADATVPVTCP